jgi:hypothetical protein
VFTGDVNNPNFNWQELLTPAQKKAVELHVEGCQECKGRMNNEVLTDAWFSSFMNDLRKKSSAKSAHRPV